MNKAVSWLYRHQTFTTVLSIISILLVVIIITTKITAYNTINDVYPTTAVITEVNHVDDYIVAINHSRTFVICPADDWHEGDHLSILLDRKNTVTMIDDEIINYHYTDLSRTEDSLWIVHTMYP